MKQIILMVISLSLISTSALADSKAPLPTPVSQKDQERYQSAYRAGCDYATFGRARNDLAFETDKTYHDGWMAGYGACVNRGMMQNTGKPSVQLNNLF